MVGLRLPGSNQAAKESRDVSKTAAVDSAVCFLHLLRICPVHVQGEKGCVAAPWRFTQDGYLREILTARVYDVAVRISHSVTL